MRRPGLMARRIVRVITPGTVNEELVLSADEKNFLLASSGALGRPRFRDRGARRFNR